MLQVHTQHAERERDGFKFLNKRCTRWWWWCGESRTFYFIYINVGVTTARIKSSVQNWGEEEEGRPCQCVCAWRLDDMRAQWVKQFPFSLSLSLSLSLRALSHNTRYVTWRHYFTDIQKSERKEEEEKIFCLSRKGGGNANATRYGDCCADVWTRCFFSSFFFVINLINVTSLVSEREVKAVLGEK